MSNTHTRTVSGFEIIDASGHKVRCIGSDSDRCDTCADEARRYRAAAALDGSHGIQSHEAKVARNGIAEVLDGVRPWTIATDRAVRFLERSIADEARCLAALDRFCAVVSK